MASYPILFSFRHLIAGNGFVASVVIDGRALLTQEDGGFWLFGVQPGGIAGGGSGLTEALNEFKKGYLSVLFDIATESKSFDEYKAALTQFFCEVNPANEDAWKGALQEVRQGKLALSGFGSAKAESWMPKIDVQNVGHHATPTVNAFDSVAEAA
jgi:hypothetical protein